MAYRTAGSALVIAAISITASASAEPTEAQKTTYGLGLTCITANKFVGESAKSEQSRQAAWAVGRQMGKSDDEIASDIASATRMDTGTFTRRKDYLDNARRNCMNVGL